MSEYELTELIRLNNDKKLMSVFISKFHNKILNICKSYKDEYLETDLTIGIINLIYNLKVERFINKSSKDLLSYINRCLENKAIDIYRSKKSLKSKMKICSIENLDYLMAYYDKYNLDEVFKGKLSGLTDKQKNILYLEFVKGFDDKEVGKLMDTSRQNINSIKNRAIKSLENFITLEN